MLSKLIFWFLGYLIEKVKITFLEEEISTNATKSNGQKMSEALNKLAKNNVYSKINPQKWQQEIRQDRSLPNRD